MQTWYETYKDQGLIVVALLVEAASGVPPVPDDLAVWADSEDYGQGQTFPVLADPGWIENTCTIARFSIRDHPSLPSTTLLGPGAVVLMPDGEVHEQDLIDALQ